MDWYLYVLTNYFKFSGRARRKEYWMFHLFHIIFSSLLLFLFLYTNEFVNGIDNPLIYNDTNYLFLQILGIYSLATLIPILALSSRRMHDLGKSGAWFLINLIPYIGSFWFLILTCMEGESRTNSYGENPKGLANYNAINQIGKE